MKVRKAGARGTMAIPVEVYSPEAKSAFLLANAVDEKDYAAASAEVRREGLDPRRIRHSMPRVNAPKR